MKKLLLPALALPLLLSACVAPKEPMTVAGPDFLTRNAAVTHDTLHRLANVGKAFDPINSKAKVLTTVCNVSRLLQTEVKALESKVQPGFPGQPARVCEYFFTMRHQLDPFGIPQPFDPQNWPDAATISAGRYLRCMPKHIHQLNVHDINHYLVNPEIHVPLFRLLTTQAAISDDEFENAKNRFPPFGKLGDETAIAIRKRLENRAPKLADEWPKIGAIW